MCDEIRESGDRLEGFGGAADYFCRDKKVLASLATVSEQCMMGME